MKRAKHPPPGEARAEAAVVADALLSDRDDEWVRTTRADLIPLAIAEYLRTFPKARNVTNNTWLMDWYGTHGYGDYSEATFVCFFCRKDLNTLPKVGLSLRNAAGALFIKKLNKHSDVCAMQFLAGIIDGKGPPKLAGQLVPRTGSRADR